MTITKAENQRSMEMGLSMYVRSRFYPPLPSDYGILLARAVRNCAEGRGGRGVRVPAGLNPQPACAKGGLIRSDDLVEILRAWWAVDQYNENLEVDNGEGQ